MQTRRTGVVYLLLALCGTAVAVWLFRARGEDGSAVAAVVTVLLGLPTMWLTWEAFRVGRIEARAAGGPSAQLSAAADELADEVWDELQQAASDRQLRSPAPIPVRWRWSRSPVAGPMEAALGDPQSLTPFSRLPQVPASDVTTVREGGLSDLFKVYGGLGSGRIVVLGGPGSGKSDAAILTVLEALKHRRDQVSDDERDRVPVPVLLKLTTWDTGRLFFKDWVSAQLSADHPLLRSAEYGGNVAERLLKKHKIALFLDGFDELDTDLRKAALKGINEHAASRVMMFTRTAEFTGTEQAAEHTRGAAVLELTPITGQEAAEYLRRCPSVSAAEQWERLICHLRDHQDSVLTQALNSPLTLTLVRDAFPDPETLEDFLAPGRFSSRDEVVLHLLDRFVTIAYQPPLLQGHDPSAQARPRHWLRYLAARLSEQGDSLDWRHLNQWAPVFPRIVALGLISVLTGALGGVLAFASWGGGYSAQGIDGAAGGAVYGAVMGLILGGAAGLGAEFRGYGRGGRTARGPLRRDLNPGVAIVVGSMMGFWFADYVYTRAADGNTATAAFAGILIGVGSAAVAGMAATQGRRARQALRDNAWTRWKAFYSRVPLLPGAVAGGLPMGFRYLFPYEPFERYELAEGLWNGVWGTVIVSLIIGAGRPASRQGILTGRSAAWRRDRRESIVYGLLFGLSTGAGWGLREIFMYHPDGQEYGWQNDILPGLFQTVGIAIPFAVGCVIAGSDYWRNTLLFLQLYLRRLLPARGMRFFNDAYTREILRTEGPRYQFRHRQLQKLLAREHRNPV
ncbi:hypothetical protein [Streptomyces iconiensis]|uniref:NACHT domain-containing protein n=1 Tax=Streptomyces iconiensis TaxID=1384038 RepID=A0ABT7A6V1_9ACTN|nr:hypothetical protein [Streptomyces iconiensis]MDJ1136812.1 hypothetical protein [Streptomyces iconiensis]